MPPYIFGVFKGALGSLMSVVHFIREQRLHTQGAGLGLGGAWQGLGGAYLLSIVWH